MKNEPLLSIVVPVYNARETLTRCVDSILNQTMNDFEVILVDDGSTDGVEIICDRYEKCYNYIHVIHQENKGPLASRIAGCRAAKGKYISFVDSDDWIEDTMYEKLLQEMLNADMLASGIIRTAEDGSINGYSLNPYPEGEYYLDDPVFLENVLFRSEYTGGVGGGVVLDGPWSKLLRRSLVVNILNKADVYIREFEDWLFNCLYILQCKKIKIINQCYYHYVTNPKSIGHTTNKDYLRQQNIVYDIMKEAVEKHPYREVLLTQLQKKITANLIHAGMIMGFNDEALLPTYRFVNTKLLYDKRIVLFGAGEVGKNYFIDFHRRHINIVLWIDNIPSEISMFGQKNVYPSEINNVDFDYVVCAIRGEMAANSMKEQLKKMNIEEERILWDDPVYVMSEYFSS